MSNLEGTSSSSLETNTQPEHTVLDTTAAIPSAPVPDVLLSLAKDDRYISQITKLLSQSIVPITPETAAHTIYKENSLKTTVTSF